MWNSLKGFSQVTQGYFTMRTILKFVDSVSDHSNNCLYENQIGQDSKHYLYRYSISLIIVSKNGNKNTVSLEAI